MIDLKRDVYDKLLSWKNRNSDKVLLVEGARQVGKTYIVKKFAKENYSKSIYINMLEESGRDLLEIYESVRNERLNGKLDRENTNSLKEMFRRFSSSFSDDEDCLIIIDEIQESYTIYNMIRQFARDFDTKFIVTGSYLGRVVLKKEFWSPMGDVEFLEVTPLTFEEFISACGLSNEYSAIDFYGASDKSQYDMLYEKYKDYLIVGGYPELVCEYLQNGVDNLDELFERLLRIFCEESARYFDGDILNARMFEDCIDAIAMLLVNNKKGLSADSYTEELQAVINKRYSSNISKENVNRVLQWFYAAKFVKDCDKVIDYDFSKVKKHQRYFLSDVGMTNYVLKKANVLKNEADGVLNETFVYHCLVKKIDVTPMFGVYGDGELDFVYRDRVTGYIYGIEVKSGKNVGKTLSKSLSKGKIDFAIYLKGVTQGGIVNKTYTIPIYLFPKFRLNLM